MSHRIQEALHHTVLFHGDQYRKRLRGAIQLPYAVHPIEVMKTIWQWETVNEVMACGALFHDVFEDTAVTEYSIEKLWDDVAFGKKVVALMQELTFKPNASVLPSEHAKLKDEYLLSFQNKSVEALVIKVADRFCNVRDFMLTDPAYAIKYYDKAKPLMQILKSRFSEIEREWGEGPAHNILDSKDALERSLKGN